MLGLWDGSGEVALLLSCHEYNGNCVKLVAESIVLGTKRLSHNVYCESLSLVSKFSVLLCNKCVRAGLGGGQ